MTISDVKNGNLNRETFFGVRDQGFLLASAPDSKLTLNLKYDINWFDVSLGLTRFSEVELVDYNESTDTYSSKFVTDLNLGFKLSDNIKLNVGGNNLLNVYPDQQDDWSEGGGYWDSVQMGISGAYYYAKVNLNF